MPNAARNLRRMRTPISVCAALNRTGILLNVKLVIAATALIASTGMLILRFGGKGLDFSQGLWHALSSGYLWLIGIFVGWLAGLLFALTVTRLEISTALSLYVPLVYAFTVIGGLLVLREPFSTTKIFGFGFILVGLYFVVK